MLDSFFPGEQMWQVFYDFTVLKNRKVSIQHPGQPPRACPAAWAHMLPGPVPASAVLSAATCSSTLFRPFCWIGDDPGLG